MRLPSHLSREAIAHAETTLAFKGALENVCFSLNIPISSTLEEIEEALQHTDNQDLIVNYYHILGSINVITTAEEDNFSPKLTGDELYSHAEILRIYRTTVIPPRNGVYRLHIGLNLNQEKTKGPVISGAYGGMLTSGIQSLTTKFITGPEIPTEVIQYINS